jgi:hypothetical protein
MIEEKLVRPRTKEPDNVPYFESCISKRDGHSHIEIIDDSVDGLQRKINEQEILINQLEYLLMHTEAQCSHWKRIACA